MALTYLPPPDADPRHHVPSKQADKAVQSAVLSDAVVPRIMPDKVALIPEASEDSCGNHVDCKVAGKQDAGDNSRQYDGQAS